MSTLVAVLVIVIIGGGAFAIISGQSKKKREKDARFAESMGMEFQEKVAGSHPGFTGSHEGLPFKIWNETDTDSDYSSVLHVAEMKADRMIPSDLEISVIRTAGAGKFLDKTIGKIGGEKVEFDDSEFNERAIVKCQDADLARTLVNQDIRLKLKAVEKGRFRVKKDSVRFDDSGQAQKNEGNLKAVVPVLALLTRELNKLPPGN